MPLPGWLLTTRPMPVLKGSLTERPFAIIKIQGIVANGLGYTHRAGRAGVRTTRATPHAVGRYGAWKTLEALPHGSQGTSPGASSLPGHEDVAVWTANLDKFGNVAEPGYRRTKCHRSKIKLKVGCRPAVR